MEYRSVQTTCPYCGVGCNLELQVVDGRVSGVLPAKGHPVGEGRLCIKGWNAHSFVHHPDRLSAPLVKRRGRLCESTWQEALARISARLTSIRDEHGPDSIGVLTSAKCTNEENYILQKFARAVIGTNNVDHCARLCHSPTVAGLVAAFGSGAMTNSIPEIESCDCILITGSNTSEAHPLIASRVFRAKDSGAQLIVVDPRNTQVARLADVHLRQRPGTDVAWINGMMHVILEEGLADKSFIAERTEGFAELEALVGGYTPERVESIADIPADDLRRAARIYGQAGTASIIYAMGITQHTNGRNNVLSCANLAMLTGNVGRPSTGVNPLRGQNNVQGACDLGGLPNVYPGYLPVTDEAVRKKMEAAWNASLPPAVGLTLTEMIELAYSRELKAMYVMGENPMLSDPDINHAREALSRLDFLVVQDIFLSETAETADVVLPAASFAEKDGTFTATDRRIQLCRKAIDPPGEARQDWEIVCQLAQLMGAGGFEYGSPAEIMEEIARLTPIYGGVSYERLARGEVLHWPIRDADDPGTPYLHQGKFSRGLGRFHAVEFKEAAELPDDEYPLILTTGRLMFHWHTGTMTRRSEKLAQEVPEAFVEIHPVDAVRIGLDLVPGRGPSDNGSRVRVISRRGEIEVGVRLTDKIKPGVVFIPFHFAEAAANALTNSAFDPIAKIPEYKVCAVRVQAARDAG